MAKKKKRTDRKRSAKKSTPKKSPRLPAWKELVALLSASNYVDKVTIIAKLKALGYVFDKDSISYVMTAARKNGNLCVYTGKMGYTSTPTGSEALVDIRKRRRISAAWLRNVRPLVSYVRRNMAKLTSGMTQTDTAELNKELSYHTSAITQLDQLRRGKGLA